MKLLGNEYEKQVVSQSFFSLLSIFETITIIQWFESELYNQISNYRLANNCCKPCASQQLGVDFII